VLIYLNFLKISIAGNGAQVFTLAKALYL
jgi:hypothetical protein